MHECPRCGQACYCHGDIDDIVVETEEYSSENCTCECEDMFDDDHDDECDADEELFFGGPEDATE